MNPIRTRREEWEEEEEEEEIWMRSSRCWDRRERATKPWVTEDEITGHGNGKRENNYGHHAAAMAWSSSLFFPVGRTDSRITIAVIIVVGSFRRFMFGVK